MANLKYESFSSGYSPERSENTDMRSPKSDISSAENIRTASDTGKKTYENASDFSAHLDTALENKEYIHWQSDADREFNREHIDDYDRKKRVVDKAWLETQRSIIRENKDCFDGESIRRLSEDLDSNKIEIYTDSFFSEKYDPADGSYMVSGNRDLSDGKIRIRDSYNDELLHHTATHETIHDMSRQDIRVTDYQKFDGEKYSKFENVRKISGIHVVETTSCIDEGQREMVDCKDLNRNLNEGITELFTIEQMQERGENPYFSSYTENVGWAKLLRDKVGSDTVARAYFGGELDELENKVNSMSGTRDAWKELNRNMDAYRITHDERYKQQVYDILDDLDDGTSRRLVRR